MLESFCFEDEGLRKLTTDIAAKGTSITSKLRSIDGIIKESVSLVSTLAEVPNFSYNSLDGRIREIESLTEKVRRFGNIANEYSSEVDSDFFNGQEKVTNDLSNIVLNNIHIYDSLNLKSKSAQTYGRYGAGSMETQMITVEDLLNDSSVNNALKDAYEKQQEEIKKLKEFAEFDVDTLEGYSEEDKQKLKEAQNEIKKRLEDSKAEDLLSISYEKDLEQYLTSDKMNYVTRGERALSTVLDFVPVVGNIKGLAEAVIGKNLITGEELSNGERLMSGLFSCLGLGAEGAFVKNIGKIAVKDGLMSAAKFGGKETLKDMTKNAAFYGGSVALSDAGVDSKLQLGFMAAVTVFGHGKTAKAGVQKLSARTKGVSKGGFLDALRVEDKFTYKKAMANIKEFTKDRRVVLNSNGVGEIDKILNSNKNLRNIVKNLDRMDLPPSDKKALSKFLAYGDSKLVNDAIKTIDRNDKGEIAKLISGLSKDKDISKMENDWLSDNFLDMISSEKGAVENEASKKYTSEFHKEVSKFFEGDFKKNIIDVYADDYRAKFDVNKCLILKEDDEFFKMLNITEESKKTLQGINDGSYSYVRKGATNPVKTAVHEQMHMYSYNMEMDYDCITKKFTQKKKAGVSIDGEDIQINEAITELMTQRAMMEQYPGNKKSGYRYNMKRLEKIEKYFSKDAYPRAYFGNNPQILIEEFEEVMGKGTWKKFSNACDLSNNIDIPEAERLAAGDLANKMVSDFIAFKKTR